MTHLSVAESALAVDPALVRLSVGIEAAEDLIADLRRRSTGVAATVRRRVRNRRATQPCLGGCPLRMGDHNPETESQP